MGDIDWNDLKSRARSTLSPRDSMHAAGIHPKKDPEENIGGVRAKCPWCNDKNGQLKIEIDDTGSWRFNCFACLERGDEVWLWAKNNGLEGGDRKQIFFSYLDASSIDYPKPGIRQSAPATPPQTNTSHHDPEEETEAIPSSTEHYDPLLDDTDGEEIAFSSAPPKRNHFYQLGSDIGESPKTPWEHLWLLTSLTADHRKELKEERGFDDITIERVGFRSSIVSNRDLLTGELLEAWGMERLIKEGIMIRKGFGSAEPFKQFYGWLPIKQADGKPVHKLVNPILIPYSGFDGTITYLRPHKGNVSSKHLKSIYDDPLDPPLHGLRLCYQFMVPAILREGTQKFSDGKTAVVVEGEFKAAALWQVGIPAIPINGIWNVNSKNDKFVKMIAKALRDCGIKNVIVCYDNDDKVNPKFLNGHPNPKYNPDPWRRYDTKMLAVVTAHKLRRYMFGGKVGVSHLPDEWRHKGKADLDGHLAHSIRRKDGNIERGSELFRQEISELFSKAKEENAFLNRKATHGTEEDRVVACKAMRTIHERKLRVGGNDEEAIANYLRYARHKILEGLPVYHLAKEYRETVNCYYILKAPNSAQAGIYKKALVKLTKEFDELGEDDEEKKKLLPSIRALKLLIEGRPVTKSNFLIEPKHRLLTAIGHVERLYRLVNKYGEECPNLIRIASCHDDTPTHFRTRIRQMGPYQWSAGQNELDMLNGDLDALTAYSEIHEIDCLGFQPDKTFVAGDCAFTEEGKLIFPDENGIYWTNSVGYQIDDDHSSWVLGSPKFFQSELKSEKEEAEEVADLLFNMVQHQIGNLGDESGALAIGSLLAYFAYPEVFEDLHEFYSMWILGIYQGGKTTLMEILMEIWGFKHCTIPQLGRGLSTEEALRRFMCSYDGIPLPLDEFRSNWDTGKFGDLLRGAIKRARGGKGIATQDNQTRSYQIRTVPIIMGESITQDSATQSRFMPIVVSRERRKGTNDTQAERFDEIRDARPNYHKLGRYLLMRRKKFSQAVLKHLKSFLGNKEIRDALNKNERTQAVFGIPFAAINAAFELLDLPTNCLDQTLDWIKTAAKRAVQDTKQDTMINQLWREMAVFLRSGEIKSHFVQCGYYITEKDARGGTKITPTSDTNPGAVKLIKIAKEDVYSQFEQAIRRRGREPQLPLVGLQKQVRFEAYYVNPPKSNGGTFNMTVNKRRIRKVWVINPDVMDTATDGDFGSEIWDAAFNQEEDEQEELKP